MNYHKLIFFLIVLNILLPAAYPCAPAPPTGKTVKILQESAIIIWDPATQTQHFIRSAAFDSDSPDFGFLVPTPTVPQLSEAPQTIFQSIEEWIAPEVVNKNKYGIYPFSFLTLFLMTRSSEDARVTASAPQSVRVLSSQQVAGFDAVVLEADDAEALKGWLTEHQYDVRPELIEWVDPYIQNKWKICAFKIAHDSSGQAFATSPVHMTFQTERPFFPYREPSDQRKEDQDQPVRILQIFFIANERFDAELGSSATWPGRTIWSDRLTTQRIQKLSNDLSLNSLSKNLWLTALEDLSSPRPGTDDLFFAASKDQGRIVPPPIENEVDKRIPLPVDLIVLVIGTVWLVRRRRRKLSNDLLRNNRS
ncbi:MAG TPA: DUF2330 domain-containing protein [Acidobacteriota bacterium]|nr:DUF2330 domain-containing protein [Acidobacteriota bacterium]